MVKEHAQVIKHWLPIDFVLVFCYFYAPVSCLLCLRGWGNSEWKSVRWAANANYLWKCNFSSFHSCRNAVWHLIFGTKEKSIWKFPCQVDSVWNGRNWIYSSEKSKSGRNSTELAEFITGKAAEKALRINKGETAFSRQKFYRLSQSKLSYLSVFVEQLTCLFIFRITFQ